MPASRSRTERWRDCLDQIRERNGCLECSVARAASDESNDECADLVWRVRLLQVEDTFIAVEQPQTLGTNIQLNVGSELVCVMAIGQNRWKFRTRVLASDASRGQIRLAPPGNVERVQRREFYRMAGGLGGVSLPKVTCWPLLNQASAVAAEVALRALHADVTAGRALVVGMDDPGVLPEVGPAFSGLLANVGGGGIGVVIPHAESSRFDRARAFWLRVNLGPDLPVALGVVARVAHTHLDSSMNVYVGMSFDFSHHREHRDFVIAQIAEYASRVQRGSRTAA